MNRSAPRSIDAYLAQLRDELAGEDPALIQDALYDAEEYLRAEIAAHPGKTEADVLELIASTYGAPEEVAAAYRDTEIKVKAALCSPLVKSASSTSALRRFFGIYSDPRAYSSLFFMFLTFVTGIVYFTLAVVGISLSAGFAVLIIGVPFFLVFIGITRAIALGEGRLIEAVTGMRMPRRPLHPGAGQTLWQRIVEMLKDVRTWTTLAYMLLMLPVGIAYFVIAVTGLSVGVALIFGPVIEAMQQFGWFSEEWGVNTGPHALWLASPLGLILLAILGVVVLTLTLHIARGVGIGHAHLAKALLVKPGV